MMELEQLESRVRRSRSDLDRLLGEARALATQGKKEQADLAESKSLSVVVEQAIGVLQSIGEERQVTAQQQIERLVTHGLQTIFGPELSFHVVSGTRGRLATTEFVVRSVVGGQTVDTPVMDARGGGVAAVVGFLLRLVVMLLAPSRQRLALVLDETFAQLSAEYEPRLAEFLRELVDKTPVQILLVTHSEAYSDAADRVYRFALKDGATVVTTD